MLGANPRCFIGAAVTLGGEAVSTGRVFHGYNLLQELRDRLNPVSQSGEEWAIIVTLDSLRTGE
jgi:hypothetical protein